jgi:hypothetical protein
MAKKMAHPDAAADKKLFSSMMKKALKGDGKAAKVTSHLKKDIHEQKKGIKEDKSLMKAMKKKKY